MNAFNYLNSKKLILHSKLMVPTSRQGWLLVLMVSVPEHESIVIKYMLTFECFKVFFSTVAQGF